MPVLCLLLLFHPSVEAEEARIQASKPVQPVALSVEALGTEVVLDDDAAMYDDEFASDSEEEEQAAPEQPSVPEKPKDDGAWILKAMQEGQAAAEASLAAGEIRMAAAMREKLSRTTPSAPSAAPAAAATAAAPEVAGATQLFEFTLDDDEPSRIDPELEANLAEDVGAKPLSASAALAARLDHSRTHATPNSAAVLQSPGRAGVHTAAPTHASPAQASVPVASLSLSPVRADSTPSQSLSQQASALPAAEEMSLRLATQDMFCMDDDEPMSSPAAVAEAAALAAAAAETKPAPAPATAPVVAAAAPLVDDDDDAASEVEMDEDVMPDWLKEKMEASKPKPQPTAAAAAKEPAAPAANPADIETVPVSASPLPTSAAAEPASVA